LENSNIGAALADAFQSASQPITTLQVVNPYRPNTDTLERCFAMRSAIESASGLDVNGWIGNANLMDETTVEHLEQGYAFMQQLAQASGLPLAFIAAEHRHLDKIDRGAMQCPVLTLYRQLVPPWKKSFELSLRDSSPDKDPDKE
ncbi:MAG: hypothetical protein P8X55_17490, partial [Desulfosarcinaceae bacterium]